MATHVHVHVHIQCTCSIYYSIDQGESADIPIQRVTSGGCGATSGSIEWVETGRGVARSTCSCILCVCVGPYNRG